MMAQEIHKFEAAGLGKAPFRFIGMSENMWSPASGVPAKPGGCCRYCFQGIRYEFWVESADGHRFSVGCDCIRKVESKGSKLLTDAERKFRREKREREHRAFMARIESVRAALDADPTLLTDRPHPKIEGKTLRDYAEWLLRHAGDAGRIRACKMVEEAAPANEAA